MNAVNLVALLLLQVAIAAWFGAGSEMDAFFLASAVPSVVATALVGSLNVSLMPHYVEFRERDGADQAWRVVCTFLLVLGALLACFVIASMFWAPALVDILASGYDVDQKALTVQLLRLCLPSIWFLCLAGVTTSIYYAEGSFAVPGMAVALNNLLILALTAALYQSLGVAVLAIGLTLGAILQLGVVAVPLMRERGMRVLPAFGDRRLVQISMMALPLVAGSAVYKSDVLVGRVIAALLPAGEVSYLSYANRIALMVVALSGAALSTVVFPRLATRAASKDYVGLGSDTGRTMKYAGLVTAMVLVPVCAVAQPLVAFVLERGALTSTDSAGIAYALVGYAGFAYASALSGVAGNCLYSLKKVWRVVGVGLSGFAVYILLAIMIVPSIGFVGVAIASSVAAVFNFAVYLVNLRALGISVDITELGVFHFKLVVASACAWAVGLAASSLPLPDLFALAIALALSCLTLVAVSALLRTIEATNLVRYASARLRLR